MRAKATVVAVEETVVCTHHLWRSTTCTSSEVPSSCPGPRRKRAEGVSAVSVSVSSVVPLPLSVSVAEVSVSVSVSEVAVSGVVSGKRIGRTSVTSSVVGGRSVVARSAIRSSRRVVVRAAAEVASRRRIKVASAAVWEVVVVMVVVVVVAPEVSRGHSAGRRDAAVLGIHCVALHCHRDTQQRLVAQGRQRFVQTRFVLQYSICWSHTVNTTKFQMDQLCFGNRKEDKDKRQTNIYIIFYHYHVI